MGLISIGGYENANLWVIMKNVKDGLRVKYMSDLVLKEIFGAHGKKI